MNEIVDVINVLDLALNVTNGILERVSHVDI